ncbi:MAG TPA: phosphate signaling complex protein PhoU [Bacteroidia bacterium]|jgi:phosphate transport system protein|nr:phosphate signaling complex protein PhoU [Bacteroidota bacterium]MBK7430209.1 phosphate signaling complex protein PhoU [Bacteroidota bacterium]MBP9790899.1 phosphate signaling complex protein PhoU [Bacteroidia bacterium]MBP9922525.1 phosphate signaling complex protein PhoU [Bacteroidia bacterium]HQW23126.1 phosphate signaling complex protein PhoU [Bacteroidia bacterium]
MTHLDVELKRLKDEIVEMFELVTQQMKKSQLAFIGFDREIAREVNFNEKRVNALELKIDKDCENIFALFNPVAIDLRFVLAVLKINSNLERIGDIADGISRYVIGTGNPFDKELIDITRVNEMFVMAVQMLSDVQKAFDSEDTKIARGIFQKDDLLDEINENANSVIENYIRSHEGNISQSLHIISAIRKLERTGDQVKNVAEEIIFFLEAKVLKHVSEK